MKDAYTLAAKILPYIRPLKDKKAFARTHKAALYAYAMTKAGNLSAWVCSSDLPEDIVLTLLQSPTTSPQLNALSIAKLITQFARAAEFVINTPALSAKVTAPTWHKIRENYPQLMTLLLHQLITYPQHFHNATDTYQQLMQLQENSLRPTSLP
jgi:hypothetical protein